MAGALAAEAMVRDRPLCEEGWRLLALAHWAGGRRADALAALRRRARSCATNSAATPHRP
ncbi:hypothetical protein [Streptomyces justiciae]|uniref:Uncharacterized protein n=1 Tax=Streptomyces justiciae TaxID=2780140 RepID=A0ABU3M3Q1_9ACTN|nr:hypothetical protein [Streptomyces justiciae]MDT7846126.1 hypothetical protein [Streptomyces justiciae]